MKTEMITIGQVLLLLLLVLGCNILTNAKRRGSRHNRISGGYTAAEGEFPSFVGLRGVIPSKPESKQICGGDLIMEDLILTAGQCFLDEQFQIFAAPSIHHPDFWEEKGIKTYEVEKRCLSDDFSMPKSLPSHPTHDYQMLRLKTPILGVNFSLAPKWEMKPGESAVAVGLGKMADGKFPNSLQASYIESVECEGSSGELDLCFENERNNGHSCMGDVGSPAYVQSKRGGQVLVGISSTESGVCKKRDQSLYTNVYKALAGIKKIKKECSGK